MDWGCGHWTSNHLRMSVLSFAQVNELNMDEWAKDIRNKNVPLLPSELDGRKRTLTGKGFEYQLTFKMRNYEDALTKLRNC